MVAPFPLPRPMLPPGMGPPGLPPGLPLPGIGGPGIAPGPLPPGAFPPGPGVVPPGMGTGPMGMMAPPGLGPPGMPPPGLGLPPMGPPPGMMPPPGMGGPGAAPPGMMPPPDMGPPPLDTGPFKDPVAIATLLGGITDEDLPGILKSLQPGDLPTLINILAEFPDVQDRVIDAVMPEEDPEPEDPWWFAEADYPKPDWGEIDAWVNRAEGFWQPLRTQMGIWEDIFFQRRSGLFSIDQDDKEFERFWASGIRADTMLAINHAASAQLLIDVTPLSGGGKDEAQRCEDTWHTWRQAQEERHSTRGNSNLRYDETFITGVRGRVVARQTILTEDPGCPLAYVVLDPAAVYPAWDDYGISAVAHVYQCTLGEAATAFADKAGQVRTVLKDAGPDGKLSTASFAFVTVVEWWDRRWHAVKLRDGRILKEPKEHGYREVPFVYTVADTGKPAVLRQASAQPRVTSNPNADVTPSDELRLRDVGLPLFAPQLKHQEQLEALGSKGMQLARMTDRPPVNLEQNEFAKAGNPDPEVLFEPGAINRTMKEDERLNPMQITMQAGVIGPLMGMLGADAERVYQPKAAYGASGGVSTGNAMEGQMEAGRDKEIALVATLERHYGQVANLAYRQIARLGHLIGKDGSRGEFRVPFRQERRRDDDAPPTFVLTPRTILKASPRVKARLTHVEMRNLPALLNTMNIAKGMKLPLRPFIELAGWPNARDFLTEGLEEELEFGADSTPLYRFMLMMEQHKNADGSWDPMKAAMIWNMVNAGKGQQGGPGGAPGGGMPGGGGLPVNTSAMNLSPQAFPQGQVGMGAGRPVSSGAGLMLGPGGVPGGPPPGGVPGMY